MVVLQLCRWKFSHKKLCSRLCSKLTFIPKKRKNSFLSHPFGLGGNVCTPSIAHWKARGQLYIRHNWTSFAISYGWDVISGNLSKSTYLEGGGSLWVQISEGREHWPPTIVGVKSSRVIALSCGIKIFAVHHLDLSQSTHVTDGRADRQHYDAQDRPRICSRGKNCRLENTQMISTLSLCEWQLKTSIIVAHFMPSPSCQCILYLSILWPCDHDIWPFHLKTVSLHNKYSRGRQSYDSNELPMSVGESIGQNSNNGHSRHHLLCKRKWSIHT